MSVEPVPKGYQAVVPYLMVEDPESVIQFLKAAFNADTDGLAGIQQLAGDATRLFYMTDEGSEGKNAFLEKRKPDFAKYPRLP